MDQSQSFFVETLHQSVAQRFAITRVLCETQTDYQKLMIFENPQLGRVMVLDGVVQTTTADEFMYHEMIAHVPLIALGAARRVLIIGGGDGGTLRRCLEHPSVDHVTMVEIDGAVIDLSRQWLPEISGNAFEDSRVTLIVGDGCAYVRESDTRFDVIIIDSTDPMGPGEGLFTHAFYQACKARLNAGGIVVTQNGVPFFQPQELTTTMERLKGVFLDRACFSVAVPTYYGGIMTLGWASDDYALRTHPLDVLKERFRNAGLKTRYYTPEIHQAAFALPAMVRALFA